MVDPILRKRVRDMLRLGDYWPTETQLNGVLSKMAELHKKPIGGMTQADLSILVAKARVHVWRGR